MPSFDISQFKSSINTDGVLLNNKYLIVITPPAGLRNKSEEFRQLVLRCNSVSLPEMSIMTDNVNRYGYGPTERGAFTLQFRTLTMQVLLSRLAGELTLMNAWMQTVVNTDTQKGIWSENSQKAGAFEYGYKADYATTITVYVYNDERSKVIEYTFYEAWPVLVAPSQLDWENSNQPLRAEIHFEYRNFLIKTIAKGNRPKVLTSFIEELTNN